MAQAIPTPLSNNNNGYHAWLNYQAAPTERAEAYRAALGPISGPASDEASSELERATKEISGVSLSECTGSISFVVDDAFGEEGYSIASSETGIEIRSAKGGQLYAVFALLRHLQLGRSLSELKLESSPYYAIRMLNHWDDPKFDHTLGPYNITRGFAGNSIFNWADLSAEDPRYIDYARLLASTGINATCINNVNADPDLLETTYLPGIKSLADRLRPYGIKLYLAICFSAPMVTDGTPGEEEYGLDFPFCMRNRKVREGCLETADPRDPRVQQWWADKVSEIYKLIPDFGGFVVKANSEGMPGPQAYGLDHADGANCIARALKPHNGLLFWRSFVHSGRANADPRDPWSDGCCGPHLEFTPLDGKFDDNVILQTKNGPADFRADEPPSTLLGAVPNTAQALEFMAAQEYLGHTTHVAYQAHHWSSILNFDTHQQGEGSTVAAVTAGHHGSYKAGAIVAVPNFGDDPNWFGHQLAGANQYAFGCLAWDPTEDPAEIAEDWTIRTLGEEPSVIKTTTRILNESYPTFARYAAPLGLGYMHESAHHYEPMQEKLGPRLWNEETAGFDRSIATGSKYLGQFTPEAAKQFDTLEACPIEQWLFFHELPWNHEMPDGRTLAQFIAENRTEAVEVVREWLEQWQELQDKLDPQTWAHIYERMNRQYVHAGKWRDEGLKALERVGQYPLK